MTQRETSFAVGFIGRSGVGKTTLATRVLDILCRRGLRCAAIKDAHHGFDIDRPGKDSWRYREAGAAQVIVVSDKRWAMLSQVNEPPTLESLMAKLEAVDIVIIEGFKSRGSMPKIEVRREGASREDALFLTNRDIVAVAADLPDLAGNLPWLDMNCPEAVADFIVTLKNSVQ